MLLLLIAIFNHLIAGKRPYIRSDNRTGLILTIFADLMLAIGLVLWFAGPWGYRQIEASGMGSVMSNATTRFYVVEHLVGMLLAIILIHIGKAQGKKKTIGDRAKHRRTLLYYTIALVIILASIPWPFREIGAGRGWI